MIRLLHVHFGSQEEAMRVGEDLVERRMVACANVIPGMTSMYMWQEQFTCRGETVLQLKTTDAKVAAVRAEVQRLHSYDTPAIIEMSGTADPAYEQWVRESVS